MLRVRFLKQLAAIAALIVVTTAASAGAAHADGARPTASPSTATFSSTPPGAVRASGDLKVLADTPGPGTYNCKYGYPCLYDGDYGSGTGLVLEGCGWFNLMTRDRDNWANSARTYGNSITVYGWTGSTFVNWGTVPSWSYWQFQLVNQIDAVNVNCASTPMPF
ncbi:hypothetical protein Nm8I071_16290 [Nonomuraea sp. TT08I-71]|nr:hypothetical protein Nm8I071_16290 [Nonomuraea sp. TT08I-71]